MGRGLSAPVPPLPRLDRIPPEIAAAADYEPFARERLSPGAFAYLAGGAADEVTLARNRAAFDAIALPQSLLADLAGGHTRLDLFGRSFDYPILLAPVANQKLAHPDGEIATVTAAAAMKAGMVVSTQANVGLEEIAARAAAPLWFQLYIQHDRAFTESLVRRAEDAGYAALVVTADAPVNGLRNREQRAGFALPPGLASVNLEGVRPAPSESGAPGGPVLLGGPLLAAAPGWRDLAWMKGLTRLPVLIKGVMSAADARRALEAGMDGIIVSNHGGRVLDGQPATLSVLPEIAEAVAGACPVLLDGGIRRGADVFRALALGARAVLIGRPYIFALAAAGEIGVAHVLHLLRAELELTMALTACPTLAAIDRSALWDGTQPGG